MTDEEMIEIAYRCFWRSSLKWKEPKDVSMPLDTGDNKPRYGWSQEARRIYGEPSSSFCNFDVDFMSAPVAVMMNDSKTGEPVNPSLDESCHYSRMGAYLDLNPLNFLGKIIYSGKKLNLLVFLVQLV